MQATDRGEFTKLITQVLAFYRQDVSTFALGVWWSACSPFDLSQVSKAFTAHATDPERGQFAPKPADIVRALAGTQTDRALVAWGKAFDTIRRVGGWDSVVFDDGLVHAVIEDLGGWSKFCAAATNDELPHLQRRFCESYRTYARRQGVAYPNRLVGIHEAGNGLANHKVAPPVLIGNPEAAREVLRLGGAPKVQITHSAAAMPHLLAALRSEPEGQPQ
jgi:hypothetical protein